MYGKATLTEHLKNLGIEKGGTVLVHSSMKSIGEVEGGAETVIDVFIEYLSEKGNLILPSHSWSSITEEHNVFDPETEPSCVGIIPELFRKRKGVIRSLHPTHSVAAIGKDAREYIEGDHLSDTPCPRNGCWGKLYDLDAKIIFLGCSPKRNTFLHSVEEWLEVPERLTANYVGMKIKIPNQSELFDRPMRRHFNPKGDVSNNYDRIIPRMEEKNLLAKGKFGNADCIVMRAKDAADETVSLLKENINFFGFE